MYAVIVKEYGYPRYKSVPAVIFDDLLEYVKKNKDVWRVVVPQTSYGYETGLIDSANIEYLETHYPRAVKLMEYNATISRWKFLQSEDLQDIIKGLAEDYPLISDDIHSRLQNEAMEEAWNDWAASEIDDDLSPEQLLDVLEYFGTGIWEVLQFDNDGTTVYLPKSEIEQWQATIADLSANQ